MVEMLISPSKSTYYAFSPMRLMIQKGQSASGLNLQKGPRGIVWITNRSKFSVMTWPENLEYLGGKRWLGYKFLL